jgi:hypothetical protein
VREGRKDVLGKSERRIRKVCEKGHVRKLRKHVLGRPVKRDM